MDDVDRIMAVMEAAFDPHWGEAWNRRQLTDSLAMPNTHYQLCDGDGEAPVDGQPAAAFTLTRSAPGEEELMLIAVLPEFRNTGLGKDILRRTMDAARSRGASRIFLEMREGNGAESLYRAAGFEPIGRRKNYYRTGDDQRLDAITFGCTL